MTIQFSPNHPSLPGAPIQPGAGDTATGNVRHADTTSVNAPNPGAWRDVPSDASTHAHFHAVAEGRVPLSPPPAGETTPQTRQQLASNFGTYLKNSDSGGQGADQGGSGAGNGANKPQHHFTVDDLLSLLITESAQGYKQVSTQTQLATTEKIEFLDDERAQITSGGKDREIGGILSNVGTMVQGVSQMAGAGVNLKGIGNASTAINEAATEAAENNGTLDATSRAQLFNSMTAGSAAWSQGIGGAGTMTQGGFNIGQAAEESDAVKHDAAKAADEKGATAAEALHDNAQSMKQQMLQVMQDYVDKEKNLEQSRDQTMKTIARSV